MPSKNDEYFQKFLTYIDNAGGAPTIENFDEDWDPVGRWVRAELEAKGFTTEEDGTIQRASSPPSGEFIHPIF